MGSHQNHCCLQKGKTRNISLSCCALLCFVICILHKCVAFNFCILTLELQVKMMTMDVEFIVYALRFSTSVEVQV